MDGVDSSRWKKALVDYVPSFRVSSRHFGGFDGSANGRDEVSEEGSELPVIDSMRLIELVEVDASFGRCGGDDGRWEVRPWRGQVAVVWVCVLIGTGGRDKSRLFYCQRQLASTS